MTRNLLLTALALAFFCTVAEATISGGSSSNGSTLTPIATGNLLGNTSGSTAVPSAVPIIGSTGDLNITSSGVVTVTGIQGASVSTPTGTGAVVLATSPSLSTATLGSGSVLTDTINQGYSANTAATTVYTSTTSLGAINGLSVNLTALGTYDCFGHLSVAADSAGGIKLGVSGSTGITSLSFTFTNWNGATVNAKGTVTAANTATAGATAAASDVDIQGVVVVSSSGSFYPEAAENASDTSPTTINKNSYFACQRVN